MPNTTKQTREEEIAIAGKLKPYTPVYDSLSVTPLDAEWNKKTCDYWYLVQNRFSSHTAFSERKNLLRWLSERNLTIDESTLAPHMQGGPWLRVTGKYADQMHMSYDEFYSLPNVVIESKVWSNGEITLARITEDETGMRTVHTLNPNCKHRPVYDWRIWQEVIK